MDKDEIIKKLKDYKILIQSYFDLDKLILFGSYSRNEQTEDSDIDVAIVVNSLGDDYFTYTPLIWKLRKKIDDRIEPVLFHKDNDPSGFLSYITETGIIID
jgi:uncharacterized protein